MALLNVRGRYVKTFQISGSTHFWMQRCHAWFSMGLSRLIEYCNCRLTVNVVTYVFDCSAKTSGVNQSATDTVSPTWRWCIRSPHGWTFSGSLLNQLKLKSWKSLIKIFCQLPSWKQDTWIYSDCLANLFSFRFATATVLFLTKLTSTNSLNTGMKTRLQDA